MMPIDFDCFFINRRRMNYLFLRIQINGHNMLKKKCCKKNVVRAFNWTAHFLYSPNSPSQCKF